MSASDQEPENCTEMPISSAARRSAHLKMRQLASHVTRLSIVSELPRYNSRRIAFSTLIPNRLVNCSEVSIRVAIYMNLYAAGATKLDDDFYYSIGYMTRVITFHKPELGNYCSRDSVRNFYYTINEGIKQIERGKITEKKLLDR